LTGAVNEKLPAPGRCHLLKDAVPDVPLQTRHRQPAFKTGRVPEMTLRSSPRAEGIVIGVADAADGRLDTGFGKALAVPDRQVLRFPVVAMNEARRRAGSRTRLKRI